MADRSLIKRGLNEGAFEAPKGKGRVASTQVIQKGKNEIEVLIGEGARKGLKELGILKNGTMEIKAYDNNNEFIIAENGEIIRGTKSKKEVAER